MYSLLICTVDADDHTHVSRCVRNAVICCVSLWFTVAGAAVAKERKLAAWLLSQAKTLN